MNTEDYRTRDTLKRTKQIDIAVARGRSFQIYS